MAISLTGRLPACGGRSVQVVKQILPGRLPALFKLGLPLLDGCWRGIRLGTSAALTDGPTELQYP